MFANFSLSWQFAKMSYKVAWQEKRLLIFPLISGVATLLVLLSFLGPLYQTGTLEEWSAVVTGSEDDHLPAAAWITLFGYYLVNYFVIVFFNSALVVCAMRAMQGEKVSVGDGLATAGRRIHAILSWAFVSALIGVTLRALESNKRIGRFVVAILGTAWTAMTFFVVPVIVLENLGPFKAISESVNTLKRTWGKALVGNFSLGIINLLIFLLVALVAGALVWLGYMAGTQVTIYLAFTVAVIMFLLVASLSAAAGMVFKSMLYAYATGKQLPAMIEPDTFANAFHPAE